MNWTIEVDVQAQRALRKLDPPTARRLRDALRGIATLEDPRSKGKALTGPLKGYWRYRVGRYRIVCDIRDAELIIVAVDLGHRNHLYE